MYADAGEGVGGGFVCGDGHLFSGSGELQGEVVVFVFGRLRHIEIFKVAAKMAFS